MIGDKVWPCLKMCLHHVFIFVYTMLYHMFPSYLKTLLHNVRGNVCNMFEYKFNHVWRHVSTMFKDMFTPCLRGNLLKTVPCVSVWHQNLISKIFQNSSKLALLHSRNMASLSKKHTGPPPRPLCFVWPVTQISEDVTHWRFVKKIVCFIGGNFSNKW